MFFELPNGTIYYDLPGGGQEKYETLEEAEKSDKILYLGAERVGCGHIALIMI
jgi:hypothetical protein